MQPWRYIKQHIWLCAGVILLLAAIIIMALVFSRGTFARIENFAQCAAAGYPVTETNPPTCRYGGHTFVGEPLPSEAPAAEVMSVDFEILVDGDTHAASPSHAQTVINSQAQWLAYWRTAHASLATLPPLIPVDFRNYSVVAASLGPQTTSGFGLKITTISSGGSGTTVNLDESAPTITCQVSQTASNRYLIVRTPKLAEPVNFRITTAKRHCQ